MAEMAKWAKQAIGKGTLNAINSSNNTDDFINRVTQPTPRKKQHCRIVNERAMVKTGKPVCTGWNMYNPPKLNISKETLDKLKK